MSYLIFFVLFIFEGIISQGVYPYVNADIYSWIFILVNTLVFFIILGRNKLERNIYLLTFVSYMIKIGLLYFDVYGRDIFILPQSGIDTEYFHESGMEIYYYWDLIEKYSMYERFLGVFYNFFGPYRIIAQYFNLLISMFTALVFFKILKDLNISYKIIVIVYGIFVLLPNNAMMSVILLREALPAFFVTTSLYFIVKWLKFHCKGYFLLANIMLLGASIFHAGTIFLAVGYWIAYVFYNKKLGFVKCLYRTTIFFVCIGLFFVGLYSIGGDLFFRKFITLSEGVDLIGIMSRLAENADTRAAYLSDVYPNSFFDYFWQIPIRALYFQFSPMLWNIDRFFTFGIFIVDALPIVCCILYSGYKYKKSGEYKFILTICFICIIIIDLVFGMGTWDYMTASRHRTKFTVIYFMVLAITLNLNHSYKSKI